MKNAFTAESIARDSSERSSRFGRVAVIFLAALLLSALCLRYLPLPFIWLGWGWSFGLFAGAWCLGTSSLRVVLFNVAVVVLILASAETYLGLRQPPPPMYSDPYYVDDDVLGVVPTRGVEARSTRLEHGKLLYDVNYTIDSNGLRAAPPVQPSPVASILFFGCSFTFGEGLQDAETIPYQVGLQSEGRYKIYNFGFHGYGPNQMLAYIESGRMQHIVDTPPRFAIYQALPDHVARVAGKVPYGKHSPRYQLDSDGSVHQHGHFNDGQVSLSPFRAHLRGQLRKSAIFRTLENLQPRTNAQDVQLLLATVRESRDLLEKDYPGIEFRVILWRNFANEEPLYQELRKGFAQLNIPVDLVDTILPDYRTNPEKYLLSLGNGHPNALADRLIAQYVTAKVLSRNPGDNPSR